MNEVNYQDYHPFRPDMFFKVMMLRSGEKILCAMEKEVNPQIDRHTLKIIEPVMVVSMGGGSQFHPWISLSDSDEYNIPTEFIIAVGDMRPDVKSFYTDYVLELAKTKSNHRAYREQVTLNVQEEQKMNASIMDLLSSISPHPVRFTDD